MGTGLVPIWGCILFAPNPDRQGCVGLILLHTCSGTQVCPLVLLALTQLVPAELLAGEHGTAERASPAERGPPELLPQPGCPGCPALPAAHLHCREAPQTHDWYGLGLGDLQGAHGVLVWGGSPVLS